MERRRLRRQRRAASRAWLIRASGAVSYAFDHDVSRFDEGGCGLALAELHLAGGVGGDDGGDALIADLEDDLGKQTGNLHVDDLADELIASADAAEAVARDLGVASGTRLHHRLEGGLRDAVMAAGGRDGLELAGDDPLFEGGIADAEGCSGFAGFEKDVCGRGHGSYASEYTAGGCERRGWSWCGASSRGASGGPRSRRRRPGWRRWRG